MYFPYPKSRSTSNGWCGTATIGGAQFARSRLRTASPASGRPDVGNTPNGPLDPRQGLDKQRLGQLVNLVSDIGLGSPADRARDILGRVYEYFLSQFAGAEGKNGASSLYADPRCAGAGRDAGDQSQGSNGNIPPWTRHSCHPGLCRMHEMVLTARHPDQLPPISFKVPDDLPAIHRR